jgi:hypothetical protein
MAAAGLHRRRHLIGLGDATQRRHRLDALHDVRSRQRLSGERGSATACTRMSRAVNSRSKTLRWAKGILLGHHGDGRDGPMTAAALRQAR